MSWADDGETPKRKTREELLAAIPENVRERALERLQSPQLVEYITESITLAGVAGERPTALLVYLTGTSRTLRKPIAIIVQGASSSGKSHLLERVADLFPPEVVLTATDISPKALYHMPYGELANRFVVAGERPRGVKEETGQGTKALREMLSSGNLTMLVTISTADGLSAKEIKQPGPIAYAESTTACQLFEEDANRCLILQSDERPEQTRLIVLNYGERCAGLYDETVYLERRAVLHALHLLLEPVAVVIPFARRLAERFPSEPLEVRRAIGHVMSVIQTVALLHQYQRERDEQGRVIAQAEDYAIAKTLLDEILARTLGGKESKALKQFVERLRHVSGEFAAKELAKLLKINERTVREHLHALAEYGLIEQTASHNGRTASRWLIRAGLTLTDATPAILPSVFDACGIDESSLFLSELLAETIPADISDVPF